MRTRGVISLLGTGTSSHTLDVPVDKPKLVDREGNKPNPNCRNPKPWQNPEEASESMATIAAISSLSSICKTSIHCHGVSRHSSSSMKFPLHRNCAANSFSRLTLKKKNESLGSRKIRSVAEETLVPEEEGEEASSVDQPVSVPVSPSDILTMFFQVGCPVIRETRPSLNRPA